MSSKIDNKNTIDIHSADYELEGLPGIVDYHILKNKRYIITNNDIN
jgi:hypothetical protein